MSPLRVLVVVVLLGGSTSCVDEIAAPADDGVQQRRCGNDCQWDPWGSCVSTDGGPTPDLGPGVGSDLGLPDPGPDAAPNGAAGTLVVGGCQVGGAGHGGAGLLILLLLLLRRQRR